jgi:hypothetical protein
MRGLHSFSKEIHQSVYCITGLLPIINNFFPALEKIKEIWKGNINPTK